LFVVTNCIISCYTQIWVYYFCTVYRVSRVRDGASRTYIDHSVSCCDDRYVPSVAVYESQTATLAAHMPKSSYHNKTDKSVAATLLQSLHSILKKSTYLLSQRDTAWSIYICSTSTTPYLVHIISNTEIIIWSL